MPDDDNANNDDNATQLYKLSLTLVQISQNQ